MPSSIKSKVDDLKHAPVVLDNAKVNYNIEYQQVNKDEIIYLTKRMYKCTVLVVCVRVVSVFLFALLCSLLIGISCCC